MRYSQFVLLLFFLPLFTNAQHSEVGLMIGTSNYWGDLNPSPFEGAFQETHVAFGGFFRYNMGDYVALKLGITQGSISGHDSKSESIYRRGRNLSFKSSITEIAITGEFNILGYQPYNLYRPFSPYVFAGVAFFKYNPKAQLNGDWFKLQPLGTEGQGLPQYPDNELYKLTQFSIPFGVGVKYALNDTWNVGAEAGIRYVFTDYLDDVSTVYADEIALLESRGEVAAALANRSGSDTQYSAGQNRGNPNGNNDVYFIVGFTLSYNFLDNGLSGFRNRNSKRNGCRTN